MVGMEIRGGVGFGLYGRRRGNFSRRNKGGRRDRLRAGIYGLGLGQR